MDADLHLPARLSVWWIPQVPMKQFRVEVPDVPTARLLLDTLAKYDEFCFLNRVRPDYANAGGLDEWEEETQEWVTWCDPETGLELEELEDLAPLPPAGREGREEP